MRLRKGHYYHSSFLAMGLFNGLGPLCGLPFVTGSLPHSPQFVRALTRTGHDGGRRVVEGRLAPLLMYLGIGLPILAPRLVQALPEAAIAGVLAYVGVEGITETQLWERILLLFSPPEHRPPRLTSLSTTEIASYTTVQLALLALCWVINLSPAGLCVAFVIVALVPLREHVLPLLFTEAALAALSTASDTSFPPPAHRGTRAVARRSASYCPQRAV